MAANSNRRQSSGKAGRKPRPDFPLNIHKGTGYWCKKVRGKVYYFGKVADDPKGQAALEEWLRVKDDLLAGREPRTTKEDELTVADLANHYLTHKAQLRDHGEISPRTFAGHHTTCEIVVKHFGKTRIVVDLQPSDFAALRKTLAKTRGNVSLRNEMQRIRSVFKFAWDEGLIISPIRFGQSFAKPKLDSIRRDREKHRAAHGDRMFEADEIRQILTLAKQPLKAMVLLAANCGFGQTDLSCLPKRFVDLDNGWVDFPRPKTAVPRRCPLWPETVAAIREWLPNRPKAKDPADAGLLFLTVRGARWVKTCKTGAPKDAIGQEYVKILEQLGIRRSRVGFYALRHGFETIAGETADQVAVDAIMGHVQRGMASAYRERIGDDRLQRVADHVHDWLFPPDAKTDDDASTVKLTKADEQLANGNEDDGPTTLKLFVG